MLLSTAVFCGHAAAAVVVPGSDDAALLVQTASGPVQGSRVDGIAARRWLGLPYAEPPLGELRWKAPRPHTPWSEPLQARAYGAACVQIGSLFGPPAQGKPWGAENADSFGKTVGSEDCLSLNVWRPDSDERGLPVLVFVHGGSNTVGYSGDPMYDGARLAATANIVVVTVNYRLGLFGWFVHPALEQGNALSDSGNFGTLDIIQALRFVHDNAAAFGGDEGNVTVAGQSAGAKNVYSLLASPLAKGLLHKAIVFSGLISSAKKDKGYAYSAELAERLVVQDGLAPDRDAARQYLERQGAPWLRQYLRQKSADQLLQMVRSFPSLHKNLAVFEDGVVMPSDVNAAFEQGNFLHVPAIAGTTRDEAKLFTGSVLKVKEGELFRLMLATDPDAPPQLKPEDLIAPYLLPQWGAGLYDSYAWCLLAVARHRLDASVDLLARYQPRTYAYRFDWDRGPEPWKTLYGAAHGIDLPFVFGNFSRNFFGVDFSRSNRAGREALSTLMMQSIAAFMRSGDPAVPALGRPWPAWAAGARKRLVFDADDSALSVSSE